MAHSCCKRCARIGAAASKPNMTRGAVRVNFDYAAAHFEATPDTLRVTIAAPDGAALARLRRRLTYRLRKMALRERLRLDWQKA